jgi:hypothetical protein
MAFPRFIGGLGLDDLPECCEVAAPGAERRNPLECAIPGQGLHDGSDPALPFLRARRLHSALPR